MWPERSRHMRGGAVLGSSGKVAGLAVRFLARDMRLTGAKAAGVPAALPLAPVSAEAASGQNGYGDSMVSADRR